MTADLDAIKARCKAAEPGAWIATRIEQPVEYGDRWDVETEDEAGVALALRHPDADFIAHAREDIPALVAEVEALRAERVDLAAAIRELAELVVRDATAEQILWLVPEPHRSLLRRIIKADQ